MIYTNDGKTHVVFDNRELIDLVREYMGEDASSLVKELVTEIEILKEELVEAQDGNEAEWEQDRDNLVDIRDMADEMIEMVNGRINKKTMKYKLTRIRDIVYNMI